MVEDAAVREQGGQGDAGEEGAHHGLEAGEGADHDEEGEQEEREAHAHLGGVVLGEEHAETLREPPDEGAQHLQDQDQEEGDAEDGEQAQAEAVGDEDVEDDHHEQRDELADEGGQQDEAAEAGLARAELAQDGDDHAHAGGRDDEPQERRHAQGLHGEDREHEGEGVDRQGYEGVELPAAEDLAEVDLEPRDEHQGRQGDRG